MTRPGHATVLVTPRTFGLHDPGVRAELEAAVGQVRYNTLGRPLRAEELRTEIGDVDGLLAGLDDVDASVFAAAPRLRVARYGVGTSNVDLAALSCPILAGGGTMSTPTISQPDPFEPPRRAGLIAVIRATRPQKEAPST